MIASLDYTSTTTMLASIKSALTTAGILTTTHRETATNLIVTTSRSSRVIRFQADGTRIYIYYGTSWSSGDAVNGSVTLNANGTNPGKEGVVIITADILGFFEVRATSNTTGFICGNLDNVDATEIMWAFMNGVSTTLLHNASAMTQMEIGLYNGVMKNAAGDKYLKSPIPCLSGARDLLASGVEGLEQLCKGANYTVSHEVFGDDVVVPVGGCNGSTSYMGSTSLYIPSGNSWTPA